MKYTNTDENWWAKEKVLSKFTILLLGYVHSHSGPRVGHLCDGGENASFEILFMKTKVITFACSVILSRQCVQLVLRVARTRFDALFLKWMSWHWLLRPYFLFLGCLLWIIKSSKSQRYQASVLKPEKEVNLWFKNVSSNLQNNFISWFLWLAVAQY